MNKSSNSSKLLESVLKITNTDRESNLDPTLMENSESNTSNPSPKTNTEKRDKKKARRKVRCTEEFNHLDRRSIFATEAIECGKSSKKVTTKKQKKNDFLPKVHLGLEIPAEKENSSPNVTKSIERKQSRTRKTSKRKDLSQIDLPLIEMADLSNKEEGKVKESSTPEEKRDSEIEIKKRKKKSKKSKKVKCESPFETAEDETTEERLSLNIRKAISVPVRPSSSKRSILKTRSQRRSAKGRTSECVKSFISSGDVYVEETVERTSESDSTNSEKAVNLERGRKSVRFRNTFEVKKTSMDSSGARFATFNESKDGSFKHYRKSPHVKKLSRNLIGGTDSAKQLSPDKSDGNSGIFALISPSLRECDRKREDRISITPVGKASHKKRTTFEMPSPILGPDKSFKTLRNTSRLRSESINKEEPKIISLLTPTPVKGGGQTLEATTPGRLVRESTFTMDSGTRNQIKSDEAEKADSENVQTLNNSKSNGRRRWNKSLGVSLLDSSGNLHNISSPWSGVPLNLSVNNETPKDFTGTSSKRMVSPAKFRKSPASSSTPLASNKKHSLRFELLKENSNKKMTEVAKNTAKKRSKMPNFALIHQRAYDKLENLKEMSERKAARAKLLLSGLKPVSQAAEKAKSPAKSKKLLRYSPKKSAPLSKLSPKRKVSVIKSTKIVTPSRSNPKVPLPKKVEPSHIPKPTKNKNPVEKQGFTKLGFKVGAEAVKKTTKEEQLKAIVNKTKVQTNTVETRRNVLQNVRSNRRFELLMKMRNK